MDPTIPATMVRTKDPSTDHQKPCTKTPTPNRLTASQLASRMNSQLIIKVTSPERQNRKRQCDQMHNRLD